MTTNDVYIATVATLVLKRLLVTLYFTAYHWLTSTLDMHNEFLIPEGSTLDSSVSNHLAGYLTKSSSMVFLGDKTQSSPYQPYSVTCFPVDVIN